MVTHALIDFSFVEFITVYSPLVWIFVKGSAPYTVDDPFGRICAPNKINDVNLSVFNMIKGRNESKHSQIKSHMIVDVNLMVENVTPDKK